VVHIQEGTLHHVELWVPDLGRAAASWGWLLTELGYQPFQDWPCCAPRPGGGRILVSGRGF
jgi:hypothetical protein